MKKLTLTIILILAMAFPSLAKDFIFEDAFTTAATISGLTFRPGSGGASYDVDFSSDGVGTVYLERKFVYDNATGTYDWQVIESLTSDFSGNILFNGVKYHIYRIRAVLSAGTVQVLVTQSDRDRLTYP